MEPCIKIILLFLITRIVKADDEFISKETCLSPWIKLSKSLCILVHSPSRSWAQAKTFCNNYNANVLYIKTPAEHNTLQNFIASIKNKRFTKPMLWLDLIQNEDNSWVWSHNGEMLQFSNWQKNSSTRRKNLTKYLRCAVLVMSKEGFDWREYDCGLSQHFFCRKETEESTLIDAKRPDKRTFEDFASDEKNIENELIEYAEKLLKMELEEFYENIPTDVFQSLNSGKHFSESEAEYSVNESENASADN